MRLKTHPKSQSSQACSLFINHTISADEIMPINMFRIEPGTMQSFPCGYYAQTSIWHVQKRIVSLHLHVSVNALR